VRARRAGIVEFAVIRDDSASGREVRISRPDGRELYRIVKVDFREFEFYAVGE